MSLRLFHNPRCSTSRAALAAVQDAGVDAEVIEYLKTPLDEAGLRDILAILEDEPSALVRHDPAFAEAGLTADDVRTSDQVATVLAAHPALMQRPLLVREGAAIIGRPTARVAPFLTRS